MGRLMVMTPPRSDGYDSICLNKEGEKMNVKKWKVGFFNAFLNHLWVILGVRFRIVLFLLSYFYVFSTSILTIFL